MKRFVGPVLLLFLGLIVQLRASARRVIVYSYITEAGRQVHSSKADQSTHYALLSGGYHEWGSIAGGEKPMKLAQIDSFVREALQINNFVRIMEGETPDLVIVFLWGCMRPQEALRTGKSATIENVDDMLALVGGRALAKNKDPFLQEALVDAASEPRYFLIVSGYAPAAFSLDLKILLWRTQISIENSGISQEQAFPVLAASGATEFGRETPMPLFISIDVQKVFRQAQARQHNDAR